MLVCEAHSLKPVQLFRFRLVGRQRESRDVLRRYAPEGGKMLCSLDVDAAVALANLQQLLGHVIMYCRKTCEVLRTGVVLHPQRPSHVGPRRRLAKRGRMQIEKGGGEVRERESVGGR